MNIESKKIRVILPFVVSLLSLLSVQNTFSDENNGEDKRTKKIHDEHYKAEQWLLDKKHHAQSDNTVRMASMAPVAQINLPGSPENNLLLTDSLASVRAGLEAMKTNDTVVYEGHLKNVNQSLETMVHCYLTSRSNAKTSETINNEDDPFLRKMAAIRSSLLRKGLDSSSLDNLQVELDEGVNVLVSLSKVTP